MADPVIGATVQVLLEKLLSLAIEEAKSLRNCNKDLEMLTQNVSLIQAFIHDAERRQVEDHAVKKMSSICLRELQKMLKTCLTNSEIKEKMLNIRVIFYCTIPIVGMGGLGKTTVAKRIFNDEQIEKHFEKRVWLCLPEMSETKSFLELILESLTKRKVEVKKCVRRPPYATGKHEWQAILDSPLVAGEDDNGENSLKKILKLSYDYLPSPHLKKCFAYFAMFPKDFKFKKDQLIQLWMAEGFLHPCQETTMMEDVGNKSGIKELSASIGKLIYLRYIDLSYINIKPCQLICKLYNLQTFRANNCFSLNVLPDEMGNMISLRHIYYKSNKDFQMPLKMRQLTCLQTLQFFTVGLEKGRRIEELGYLKNLRGELRINGLQLVCNREEARTAYLQEKSNIYKLKYLWFHDEPEEHETNDEYVLDGLQPHPNLKTLKDSMVECIGPGFYGVEVSNIGSSSNNGIIQVFPSLKELELEDMGSLIEWTGVELIPTTNEQLGNSYGKLIVKVKELTCLPDEMLRNKFSLQHLSVSCGELRELPQSLYNLHSLKSLEIGFCPNFSSIPVLVERTG
ncbi:hypothetical protein HAX54_051050 [Datura stramonium]|uniref:NB-ARC domain-containing protein n=1 Tax=Datura stramonium TaxID=4076 RepID=A0ABS8RRV5_DATST|nr:hypothetical protein [Datura stramonium]